MKKNLTLTLMALLLSVASFALTPITGIFGTCIGSVSHLGDTTAGGTWSSSNTSIATVNSSTGQVYGVAAGTATISYTLSSTSVTCSFSVHAAPAAIAGPSSVCVGSTVTLTDATSGGTWSSSSSATIGAATGVATGVSAGTATIYYTVGTGCSSTATLTVSGGSGTLTDSVYGPHTVCIAGTGTYTIATTGGTWSSSNTSVATVNASTGVVTGISTGTANIIYSVSTSCGGTLSNYRTITVTGTASAGTITGTTTVSVGANTTLSDAVFGGTWSTSSATIASINATTGVVTGVAVGTATITYSATTACGAAITTTTVTVAAFTGISGHVIFSSGFSGTVKIWLITYNSSTTILQAVDSLSLTSSGTSFYYQFPTAATDTYRIKAAAFDTFTTSTGYIPTYHDTSYYWYTATVLHHTSGTGDINQNINMAYGTTTSGPGFIGGSVTTGANKGTASGAPAVGLQMYVINTGTNTLIQKTVTDASGNYSFSNLPVGQTYKIFPEAINYRTTSYDGISLTSSATSLTAANFVQHTISKTITPIYTKVIDIKNNAVTINTFPNPVTGQLNIQWNETANEKGTITVSDLTGSTLYKSTITMNQGVGATQIDLSGLANGLYVIHVTTNTVNYTNKVQVQH